MKEKIELTIKRTNGEIEKIDVTDKFKNMNQSVFNKIKESTKEAGKGEVQEAIIIHKKSNILKLRKEYNDLNNEGGEGYIPENLEYWTSMSEYKEWTETEIIK